MSFQGRGLLGARMHYLELMIVRSSSRRIPFLLVVVISVLSGCISSQTALFNGENLNGWRKVGGEATFHVEDGCIVGTHGSGPNTFLRTCSQYDDFELELDFKWDEPGNSGIQFRSIQRSSDGVVQGYQCELDPSDRSWTCGIYHEGGRGWLAPIDQSPKAQAARRLDGWNHVRIRANGPHIQTWLNGVPCADLIDIRGEASGFIALQVHSGDQGVIRWRDIRLRSLP